MALILYIETTTKCCSVALAENNNILAIKETFSSYTHAENLTLFIEEVMSESGHTYSNLDAVTVSKGPGSYMGLRIGVSTAKGLCYALDIPLIAVDTLQAMALSMSEKHGKAYDLFCPMLDARRMEVYCALLDVENKYVQKVEAKIINENSFSKELQKHKILFFGDGAPKCKDVLNKHSSATIEENYQMSAMAMIPLAHKKFNTQTFENIAYFEPFYLKDFIPGISKVKGLK